MVPPACPYKAVDIPLSWWDVQAAPQAGIDVRCCSVTAADIGEFLLAGRHLVILLVDKGGLDDSLLQRQRHQYPCACPPASGPQLPQLNYTGDSLIVHAAWQALGCPSAWLLQHALTAHVLSSAILAC